MYSYLNTFMETSKLVMFVLEYISKVFIFIMNVLNIFYFCSSISHHPILTSYILRHEIVFIVGMLYYTKLCTIAAE